MAKQPSTPKRRGRPPKVIDPNSAVKRRGRPRKIVATPTVASNLISAYLEVKYDSSVHSLDDVLTNVKDALQTINTKGDGKAVVKVPAATEFSVVV